MINRLQMAFTILFSRRVLVLKRRYDPKRQKDCVTLYGTLHDRAEQVDILRTLSDSIFWDLNREEQEKLRTLQ